MTLRCQPREILTSGTQDTIVRSRKRKRIGGRAVPGRHSGQVGPGSRATHLDMRATHLDMRAKIPSRKVTLLKL